MTYVRVAVFSLLFVLLLGSLLIAFPQSAEALETESVTATRNEDGGTDIIGGKPTRLSWEGRVGNNEKVMQIVINFPEGCELADDAYLFLQEVIMDDPMHPRPDNAVKHEYELTQESLIINFTDGLRPGNKVIIQVYGFQFPAITADYYITGTYVDDKGLSHILKEYSRPVSVIGGTALENFLVWLSERDWVKAWNSNAFCNSFLNPVRAVASVPTLFGGWLISVALVALGFPLAIPVGLGISFLRMSKLWILRFLSSIYVNVIRGTPLFLQIYIAFLGLPLFISGMDNFTTGFIVLALNSSAYLAEIFRAGIQSIHKGQFEAASSLGMNGIKTMFFVIIPQTVRRVIPTMTSEFILLFKDTSLLAAVGVFEMMMFAKIQSNISANITPYVVAAGFYLLVTLPLTRVISVFEKKLAATDGKEAPPEDKKKKKPETKRVGLFKTTVPAAVNQDTGNG
ncbi:MAG: amino acid ABC transporter permease [Coriobacteriia bacterium]|nr:amino acid ABC transporter permease [Coriobacteriia bacterium]